MRLVKRLTGDIEIKTSAVNEAQKNHSTTPTYTLSVYHHYSCEFESNSWRGVPDTTLCDKVCQCLTAGRGFFRYSGFFHQ